MEDRIRLIEKHFGFLESAFGFKKVDAIGSEDAMGNAMVQYSSAVLGIEVVVDRDQALMAVGDPADDRWHWFDLTDVLSVHGRDTLFQYASPEKELNESWDDSVDRQLGRLSEVLRTLCEGLLRGEPLKKDEIRRVGNERVKTKYGRFMDGSAGP